jgi:glycosyltransferase involved in cell wall biosynthesis
MAVVIFALGIKATNGLVKSTINTANSLVKYGIDTSIINIVGKFGGLDYLDAAFPLDKKVKKYSLDALELHGNEDIKLRNSLFYKEEQQFLTASYTMYHKKALQEIDKRLSADDLVIFVHPLAMKIYIEANPNSKVKKIIQVHGNYLEEIDNYNLIKDYFDRVDYIQTVSKYMRDDLINILKAPKDKTIYIPNIAVPVEISKKSEKYLKRISIIGSIQKRKNQFDAVRILEHIEDNNVILQIYGHELNKEYTQFIKEYIDRKELTHRVIFKSVATEEEIYSNTDLVILTSEHEGFGYTFLESAMYNIPVLAYDFKYGAKEFLRENKNGCLFEMGDYKGMAKKINEIFEDRELYKHIAQDNLKFFYEEFAEEKTVNKYIDLLGDKKKTFHLNDLVKNEKDYSFIFSNIKRSTEKKEVIDERWKVAGKPEVKEVDYFIFKMEVKGDTDGLKVFYYYKKRKLMADDLRFVDLENKHFLFTSKSKKETRTIEFKIPKINKFSNKKEINKFYIVAEDRFGKEHHICYVDKNGNMELVSNLKKHYPVKKKELNISDINHILKPNGFYIQYPSNETIKTITSDQGQSIDFETIYLRYYGEYIPFFKVKRGIYNKLNIEMTSGIELKINYNYNTFKELFLKISEIEIKYKLFDLTIDGIYFWELIRATIFETILENIGVLDKHFTKPVHSKNIKYSLKKSMWNIPDCEKLIFEFPRKNEVDYRTIALQKEFSDSIILEYPQMNGYSERVYDLESNVYPIERFLKHFKDYKAAINYSSYDKERIKWLKNIFIDEISLEIEFSQFIDSRLKKFKKEYSFFNKFFQEKQIKEILIPSSYWSAGIIAAAKDNGVTSSDIQYALISKYHPSFAFPENHRNYQADRIYLWSKYWNIKEVPFDKSIVIGNNYFKEKCNDLDIKINSKILYDIAVVSQGRIGGKIFDFAYNFAKKNPSKKIVYCPHPDEDIQKYTNYLRFLSLSNTFISNEETLLTISYSRVILAVYSTTIFEALALNKKVFILKINGYEVVEKEVENQYVELVETEKELERKLSTKKSKKNKAFDELFYNFRIE